MKHFRHLLHIGSLVALLMSTAYAQYAPAGGPSRREIEAAQFDKTSLIGKKYWIIPNKNAVTQHEFHSVDSDGGPSESKFVVTEATSFTVAGYQKGKYYEYVKIVFQDGKEAFLQQRLAFNIEPSADTLFSDIYIPKDGSRVDYIEYILTTSPADIQAVERKQKTKNAAAAAAWKARGGVRIGMTAQQARASNWGAPSSVNRSSNASGTHEQWVYGGGNYLYFQNGILTSFQN